MDHHEAGEGGRSDRLPRQILICVCGVGFFIGALLPGCALLAALRWYVLKNGLQSSDRRNILKLPAASCRESSKCKEDIPFYCSSLANPAAPLKRDLRFATTSYGECARCSIFKTQGKRFKQLLELSGGVLAFSGANFCFAQGKVEQELANRCAELLLGAVPA
jgi:hypothetical protein